MRSISSSRRNMAKRSLTLVTWWTLREKPRGQGTELRTDEWGTLREQGKGLFVKCGCAGESAGCCTGHGCRTEGNRPANQQLQQLEMAAEQAQALKADVDSQIQMFEQRLKPLNEALLMSAPEGMALTSGSTCKLPPAKTSPLTPGAISAIGTMGQCDLLTGEKLGLFARTGQLSLKSGEGPVEAQAQNGNMRLFAEKKLTLSSAGDISLTGKKRITLIGGGATCGWRRGKVEYGTTATYLRKVKRTMVAASNNLQVTTKPMPFIDDLRKDGFI